MTNRHKVSISIDRGIMQKIYLQDVKQGDQVALCFPAEPLAELCCIDCIQRAFGRWVAPAVEQVKERGATPILIVPVWKGRDDDDLRSTKNLRRLASGVQVMTEGEWQKMGAS